MALGAGVFAVAFAHVHDVAHWAHQPDWAAWLIASTGELMAIVSILEIRHRSRHVPATGRRWWTMLPPVLTLIAAIGISGAANLAAATGLAANPGPWVQIMAVWPVVAFALVAFTKATRPHAPAANEPAAGTPADGSVPAAVAASGGRASLPTVTGAVPVARTGRGTGRGGQLSTSRTAKPGTKRRTDAELIAALAGVPRNADGTVPIGRMVSALSCGPDRARRLLAAQGLLRTPTVPPAAADAAAPVAA
ncbi:hypothetical protein BL253_32755 [Pseudofrankia asymbiotica]|uniref:DUF2637 domain-containing protein n=1 Tax=Pseudofrankia asymbiotica TaxID=1834516 RepID=A0A1V2I1T0_9ACTN|nr:hypothetical protein BL253_32755 [Pseudofrankia asymbiotica]